MYFEGVFSPESTWRPVQRLIDSETLYLCSFASVFVFEFVFAFVFLLAPTRAHVFITKSFENHLESRPPSLQSNGRCCPNDPPPYLDHENDDVDDCVGDCGDHDDCDDIDVSGSYWHIKLGGSVGESMCYI